MLADEFLLGTKLYHKKFVELCDPIVKYLGTTEAMYINIDKDGRMFSIATCVKWWERLLEEQYYKLDPFMVHPHNIHNGFALDNSSDEQAFKDILLYDSIVNFNLCHSFVYIEKNPNNNGYIGFCFATNKHNHKIISRLINESQIIKTLIRNLHNNLVPIINKDLQENKVDFITMKGQELFTNQKGLIFHEEPAYKYKIELLKQVGLLSNENDKNLLTNVCLSPQEINCLRIYNSSRSIKKISKGLNLALTTVTSYIENVKIKLDCKNKNELFEKIEILELLGRI